MASRHVNLFSADIIDFLMNSPEVLNSKAKINMTATSTAVYFTVPLTDSIRSTLSSRLGLDLSNVETIPMRWIKGNIIPHVDVGSTHFENTYLAYIYGETGEFIVGTESYPITANTAFVFNEGLKHETQNTGVEPRLLLGPMNEFALPVGVINMNYYPSLADALNNSNYLGNSQIYTVGADGPFGPNGGYTSWRLASNSTGTSSQTLVYANGANLNPDGYYILYPATPCFLEGTQVLCLVEGVEKYIAIENLKKDDLVKTSVHGYKKVVILGKGSIQNAGNSERSETRLYKCTPANYPELTDDLYITGCHSILVDNISDEQREKLVKQLGRIFITDKKYRLTAQVDKRAEPWAVEGTYTIWHVALENADIKMNYGIYVNGGLLVESCSINSLKNKSNFFQII